ncbi:MAG: hypothetical protein EZS28_029022 [Streblomastix strix]|uniref:Uncharacterized protein n=1 Tax=Streblomastix strix TaxID=222440 RepID=A0A5J4V060_9EUKA|nr:MAG: hypothetical protein EZS28_029022 [Streblomastix strix]
MNFFRVFQARIGSEVARLIDQGAQLETIIDRDEVLQDFKAKNKKVVEFLTRHDNLIRLISIVLEEKFTDDKVVRFRRPFVAAELILSDVSEMQEALKKENLPDRVLQWLNRSGPFSTANVANTKKLMFCCLYLYGKEFIEQIIAKKAIETIIKHIECFPFSEMIIDIVAYVEGMLGRDELTLFLKRTQLVSKLLQEMDSTTHPLVPNNISTVINNIIARYVTLAPSLLFDHIFTPRTTTLLLSIALQPWRGLRRLERGEFNDKTEEVDQYQKMQEEAEKTRKLKRKQNKIDRLKRKGRVVQNDKDSNSDSGDSAEVEDTSSQCPSPPPITFLPMVSKQITTTKPSRESLLKWGRAKSALGVSLLIDIMWNTRSAVLTQIEEAEKKRIQDDIEAQEQKERDQRFWEKMQKERDEEEQLRQKQIKEEEEKKKMEKNKNKNKNKKKRAKRNKYLKKKGKKDIDDKDGNKNKEEDINSDDEDIKLKRKKTDSEEDQDELLSSGDEDGPIATHSSSDENASSSSDNDKSNGSDTFSDSNSASDEEKENKDEKKEEEKESNNDSNSNSNSNSDSTNNCNNNNNNNSNFNTPPQKQKKKDLWNISIPKKTYNNQEDVDSDDDGGFSRPPSILISKIGADLPPGVHSPMFPTREKYQSFEEPDFAETIPNESLNSGEDSEENKKDQFDEFDDNIFEGQKVDSFEKD